MLTDNSSDSTSKAPTNGLREREKSTAGATTNCGIAIKKISDYIASKAISNFENAVSYPLSNRIQNISSLDESCVR